MLRNLQDGGLRLLIWREQLDMRIDLLQAEEYYFLSKVAATIKFAELCQQFSTAYPDKDISAILAKSIQRGWIQNFPI